LGVRAGGAKSNWKSCIHETKKRREKEEMGHFGRPDARSE